MADPHRSPELVESSELDGGRTLWAPLVRHTKAERDALIERAGFRILEHRSDECWPCINGNREDLRRLAEDEARIAQIEALEAELGTTSNGKPRVMFRAAHKGNALGIREVVRWAQSAPAQYRMGQRFLFGCDAGFCGG